MKSNILYLAFVTLLIVSCGKNELSIHSMISESSLQALLVNDDDGKSEEEKDKDHKDDKGKIDCFVLIYPISITMPDGSVLTGEKEILWTEVKAWYELHPESKVKPELNYPVDILWKDDTNKTIENVEEMKIVKTYCDDKKYEKELCFKLIYPVTWILPDDSTESMSNDKDWDAIKDWYESNPNIEEKPSLQYPVDVLFKDETTKTISSEDEMEILKKEC